MKRTLLVACLSSLVVATIPGVAHAHAAYKSSSPAWGASISSPPSEVWVEFTERIEGGSLTIYDACGGRVDHGEDAMNLTSDRLTTGMHGDKAGTYVVKWSVLGSDGHETRGEFDFSSTGGAKCPGASEPEPEPETEKPREREAEGPRSENQEIEEDDDSDNTTNQRLDRRDGDASVQRDGTTTRERSRARTGDRVIDSARAPEDTTDPTPATSIWDGIPIGDFLIALGVAALIGAAGGRIYAGIIGPRR